VVVLVVAIAYAARYGLAEALRLRVAPPGLSWQVPSAWVRGRSPAVQLAVWGALLGPGIATRNLFAGMWLVPLALALVDGTGQGLLVGALAGFAHGAGRAWGILQNVRMADGCATPAMVAAPYRWRLIDGLALLAAAGLLCATAVV
jgi:hypothetical protein